MDQDLVIKKINIEKRRALLLGLILSVMAITFILWSMGRPILSIYTCSLAILVIYGFYASGRLNIYQKTPGLKLQAVTLTIEADHSEESLTLLNRDISDVLITRSFQPRLDQQLLIRFKDGQDRVFDISSFENFDPNALRKAIMDKSQSKAESVDDLPTFLKPTAEDDAEEVALSTQGLDWKAVTKHRLSLVILLALFLFLLLYSIRSVRLATSPNLYLVGALGALFTLCGMVLFSSLLAYQQMYTMKKNHNVVFMIDDQQLQALDWGFFSGPHLHIYAWPDISEVKIKEKNPGDLSLHFDYQGQSCRVDLPRLKYLNAGDVQQLIDSYA